MRWVYFDINDSEPYRSLDTHRAASKYPDAIKVIEKGDTVVGIFEDQAYICEVVDLGPVCNRLDETFGYRVLHLKVLKW